MLLDLAPRRPRRRVPSLALGEIALGRLRRDIVLGALAPGERLAEPELCERLGISRTPLREALKHLAAEGLVLLRRNRSAVVAPLDARALEGLFEASACIESYAAGLSATRMAAAELRRLHALQDRMEALRAAGELYGYFEINQRIHRLVVEGARNPALVEAHDLLIGRLARARYLALAAHGGRWEESIREHREILAALEARDAERARRLFEHHVGRTGELVAAHVAGAGSPDPARLKSEPKPEKGSIP